MTRKEMLKSIKAKLNVTKLPKKKDLPTSVLIQVAIEKWEGLLEYIDKRGIKCNEHYPDACNCALCYKFVKNSKLRCPISPVEGFCGGKCIEGYRKAAGAYTKKECLEGRQMVLKELKRALKNE